MNNNYKYYYSYRYRNIGKQKISDLTLPSLRPTGGTKILVKKT